MSMPSTRLGLALPVRTVENSCSVYSQAFCMCSSSSRRNISVSMMAKGWGIRDTGWLGNSAEVRGQSRPVIHQRADWFAGDGAADIVGLVHIKYDDWLVIVHAKAEGRGVHYLELA